MGREKLETRNRHAKSKVLSQKMKGATAGMEGGERESESRGERGERRRTRRRETFKRGLRDRETSRESMSKD